MLDDLSGRFWTEYSVMDGMLDYRFYDRTDASGPVEEGRAVCLATLRLRLNALNKPPVFAEEPSI